MPDENREGCLFIFPDIMDKAAFIVEFIDQVLPSLVPRLYPDLEKASWANRPEYELAAVQDLKQQVVKVRERARSEIAALEQRIQQEKEKHEFLFDLITETGDDLVEAVEKALEVLGFTNVVNADEELAEQGIHGQNREDLQVHDHEPTLIAEVKGITSYPSDEDALTVQKYVVLRMREWERVTIQGISIINQQRHLPPLERDNEMPFRQEILDASEEQSIGLMTTWDLHRLLRSYLRLGWEHENVKDIFYETGRIAPVPSHYSHIGYIDRYIEDISVIGVKIENGYLNTEDKIAFELDTMFEEQVCDSMELNNDPIHKAESGMTVGIKTHLSKEKISIGTHVYRVIDVN